MDERMRLVRSALAVEEEVEESGMKGMRSSEDIDQEFEQIYCSLQSNADEQTKKDLQEEWMAYANSEAAQKTYADHIFDAQEKSRLPGIAQDRRDNATPRIADGRQNSLRRPSAGVSSITSTMKRVQAKLLAARAMGREVTEMNKDLEGVQVDPRFSELGELDELNR